MGFSIDHDRLFYKGRYVLARSSPFIPVLLREYHDSPLGGHAGELKTYLRLAAEWYLEGMRRQVDNYVRECHICQKAKASNQSPAGLLQNLPIPIPCMGTCHYGFHRKVATFRRGCYYFGGH